MVFLQKRKYRSCWSVVSFVLCVISLFLLFPLGCQADDGAVQSPYDLFDFIGMESDLELVGNSCLFSCVIFPSGDILSVQIVITSPDRSIHRADMQYDMNGKYLFQSSFKEIGKYYFFMELTTENEGLIQSNLCSFWISSSYVDRDNDGLPDSWENQYGLNSELYYDAFLDSDNDGYSNKEEYQMTTHPLENNIFENALYKCSEKQVYLSLSFLLFCILLIFSWYGMWRETL